MKIAIIDTNYTQQKYSGLAASWLRWELKRADVLECAPETADVILMTVSSQQGISKTRGVLRLLKNKYAKIIIGGGGAYAPVIFEKWANAICVGEGSRFVRTLIESGYETACKLPETWIQGEAKRVVPNRDFPWDLPPLNHPDGTVRIFASRGCRFKCLFCQTGWENIYRTNPCPERLRNQIKGLEEKKHGIAIVTNDAAEESIDLTGQQEFISVRLSSLKRLMPLTRGVTKSVRIGVEGVSERLRRAVVKPVFNSDLLETTFDLAVNGIGVRWFFIVGLPNETEADYKELRFLVNGLKRLPKGCVMMNFHAFIPQPATPLCILPLIDSYWEPFEEFRRWFFHGPGFTRKVQILPPSQYKGRLKRARESMAATENQLRQGWWKRDNSNWRVQYIAPPDKLRYIASVYDTKTRYD